MTFLRFALVFFWASIALNAVVGLASLANGHYTSFIFEVVLVIAGVVVFFKVIRPRLA